MMVTYRKGREGFEGTRGRLVELLRAAPKSVGQLATALGITLNAVRSQLAVLERDGLVQIMGERRSLRRPSLIYGLTSEAERTLSRAYVPTLKAILKTLSSREDPAGLEELLREAGRKLADELGRPSGSLQTRIAKTLDALKDLGGAVDAEEAEGKLILRGHGCLLAEAVKVETLTCKCMQTLLAELTGAEVEERCEHGETHRCVFVIDPSEQHRETKR